MRTTSSASDSTQTNQPEQQAEHRYIFVCRGPHCTRRDSRLLRDRLQQIVQERGTPNATVSAYPCFGLCEQGPNALVYPDGVWYSDLNKWDLEPVADHLAGGPVHEEKHVDPGEIITENAFENIREAWDLTAQRARKGFKLWPFGRK